MSLIDLVVSFLAIIGRLFAAPFTNPQMLWIIIPVYLNWLFSELYQEKKGTSLGNAIANGFVALWVGIDWIRTVVDLLVEKTIKAGVAIPKIFVAVLMVSYGVSIIVAGARGKKFVKLFGRIRGVTYFTVMLTPIFYGVVGHDFLTILSIVLFFPVFYGIIEVVDRLLPNPKTYADEEAEEREKLGSPFESRSIPDLEPLPRIDRPSTKAPIQQMPQFPQQAQFSQQHSYPTPPQWPRQ